MSSTSDARDWLDALLAPRSVAVIGATDDLRRPGGRLLAALRRHGFAGRIHPVNPGRDAVQGLPCLANVRDAPAPVDVALIALPAAAVLDALDDCAAAGVAVAVVGSAGFAETGPDGAALERALARRARELGVRIVGPNTNGVVSCAARFAGSFTPVLERDGLVLADGPTAIISQSGALGAALFVQAQRSGLAVGTLLNTGNELDVSFEELLERLASDRIVLGYAEGIGDPDRLLRAARAAHAAGGFVALLKVGATPAGARAAEAHTAKLAGEDRVYEGVLRQLGIVRARSLTGLVDIGRAVAAHGGALGRRLTIAGLSGGAGIILSDLAQQAGLKVPEWAPEWQAKLAEWLPGHLGKGNPIDLAGGPFFALEKLQAILRVIDACPDSDAAVLAVANFEGERAERICTALAGVAGELAKPLFVVWIGASEATERALADTGLPCFPEPTRCIDAIAAMATRRPGSVVSGALPAGAPSPDAAALDLLANADQRLSVGDAQRLLGLYGVPVVEQRTLALGAEPPADAPLPAVLKLASPELAHKTEAGGVVAGLRTRAQLAAALREQSALATRLGLRRCELLLQRAVEPGLELLLGMKHDPAFGPVVTLGLGGVLAEAFDDVAIRLPRLDEQDVATMLGELRHQRLLRGFRHLPAADPDRIAPVVLAFARLVRAVGDRLAAIDLNPVIVPPTGAPVAVDALIEQR